MTKMSRTVPRVNGRLIGDEKSSEKDRLMAALDYLSRGWPALAVCPPDHKGISGKHAENCTSPGKAPIGRWKEFQDRLPTEAEVREQWRRCPTANVGVVLGPVSRLIRIDVEGAKGEAELRRRSKGDLPDTLEFTSGKGRGLLFAIPEGVDLRTTVKPIAVNEELRLQGKGAQTVLPPSRHKNGQRYRWIDGHGPDSIDPAPAPEWVIDLMRPDAKRSTTSSKVRDRGRIAEGNRNTHLTSLAGTMRRRGMSKESIGAALRQENLLKCSPPLEEDEVDGIAASIAKYSPGDGTSPDSPGSPYFVEEGRVRRRTYGKDGEEKGSYPLCNFTAEIVEEIVLDDGSGETENTFVIRGALADGSPLPPARIRAPEFPGLNWTFQNWGARAVVCAGQGAKDHLRAAIQLLSSKIDRRHVYRHTGWREIDGAWTYLNAAGGITAAGLSTAMSVELDGKLNGYHLPEPPTADDLVEAIRASLDLLDLAKPSITATGLGAVYRSVLGVPADGSLFFDGPTGAGKSEWTALLQQHFGAGMDRLHLPGTWTSTANAIEAQMFLAKDAVFVLDDFKPGGSRGEVDSWHSKADRVFRSQGNGHARQRCWADGSVRTDRPPRCLIVATGEDRPRGESCAARRLDVHISRGDIDLPSLTPYQRKAAQGTYAQAMAGFLHWLARRFNKIKRRFNKEFTQFRALAASDGHPRTPGIVADLACGWKFFLDYAERSKAICPEEREEIWNRAWKGLLAAGRRQGDEIRAQEPARRFLDLISSAIATCRGHLICATTGGEPASSELWGWHQLPGANTENRPGGDCIGWIKGKHIYLDPNVSYATAQRLSGEQGEGIAVTRTQLHKRLDEQGFLASKEKGKLTNRRIIAGRERAILHLRARDLSPLPESGEPGESNERPQIPPISPPENAADDTKAGDENRGNICAKPRSSPGSPDSPEMRRRRRARGVV